MHAQNTAVSPYDVDSPHLPREIRLAAKLVSG